MRYPGECNQSSWCRCNYCRTDFDQERKVDKDIIANIVALIKEGKLNRPRKEEAK